MYLVDEWSIIKPLISENIHANLNTIGRMKSSKEIQIYVDSLKTPKGFVLKDGYWVIPYSKDENLIKTMLDNIELPNEVGFCGIHRKTADFVIENLKNYELDWHEECDLFYLPQRLYLKYNSSTELSSLQESDVDIVNHYYTYKDEDSRNYLLDCIRNRPSSKLTDSNGNPISWALVREDYSLGVMYTISEHRKKGLAKIVTSDLVHKTIKNGTIPYLHIRSENTASKNLAKEMDFVFWDEILWFGLKKLQRKEE
ncbi:GNAT family N-acetyltransferase [Alkaliphilus pronyensis]|uniref:GNAT family N-acetyltransferase n=1 Tax=Alkaliphilus pronyensis TaxID=1482732 RepID=UPI00186570ED|nr:GNAT family N-acetyltransferase [Alkaliphilus pronyensis]